MSNATTKAANIVTSEFNNTVLENLEVIAASHGHADSGVHVFQKAHKHGQNAFLNAENNEEGVNAYVDTVTTFFATY